MTSSFRTPPSIYKGMSFSFTESYVAFDFKRLTKNPIDGELTESPAIIVSLSNKAILPYSIFLTT